jgi:hypothetical protein
MLGLLLHRVEPSPAVQLDASSAGLTRVGPRQGRLDAFRDFPDTEPFVDTDSRLFITRDGLSAVRRPSITGLRMA